MNLTPEQLAILQERAKLRAIQSSLLAWAPIASGMPLARHHTLLLEKVEAVITGKAKRRNLAVFLPPGSAKSTYISVATPTGYFARYPRNSILCCSHSGDLAVSFGRRCRNLVDVHSRVLGYGLSPSSKASDYWQTTKGGEYRCAGVGMGIAGFRADLGIIDDPIGKREDAESKLMRDKQWDWFFYDFRTRLKPNAPTILVQTRWHEDDLAGRILANEPNDWEVVHIPLIAGDNDALGRQLGEALWPEYFNAEHVAKARANPAFQALYQGSPVPESGDYFQSDWFKPCFYKSIDEVPKNLRVYVASDHAFSQRQEADRTCIIPYGVDENDHIWVFPDVFWKRVDSNEAVEAMLDVAERRKPIWWFTGKEHITGVIEPFLNKRMRERNVYPSLNAKPAKHDLVARAQSIRGRAKQQMVHLPSFASWFGDALHELYSFDKGTHDDFVAAFAEIGRGMDEMTRPAPAKVPVNFFEQKGWSMTFADIKRMSRDAELAEQVRYGGR